MSTHHEPGTVAVATVRGQPDVRVMRVDLSTAMGQRHYGWIRQGPNADRKGMTVHDADVTDVRPLLVLWLDDLDREVLPKWLRRVADADGLAVNVAKQIEAQTKPPEPGKYGVVVAGDGREWFRYTDRELTGHDWVRVTDSGTFARYARWQDLDVIRVIREGVPR